MRRTWPRFASGSIWPISPKSEAAAESEQLSKAKQLLKRSSYRTEQLSNRSSSYVQRVSLWIFSWPVA